MKQTFSFAVLVITAVFITSCDIANEKATSSATQSANTAAQTSQAADSGQEVIQLDRDWQAAAPQDKPRGPA